MEKTKEQLKEEVETYHRDMGNIKPMAAFCEAEIKLIKLKMGESV